MADRKLAGHIHVHQVGNGYSLTIDGEEFPWFVSADGIDTTVTANSVPSVTLSLMAERVTVEHAFTERATAAKTPDGATVHVFPGVPDEDA